MYIGNGAPEMRGCGLGTGLTTITGMVDEATKKTLAAIPLLRTNAGPRDRDQWAERLKEEYLCLIKVRRAGAMVATCGGGR